MKIQDVITELYHRDTDEEIAAVEKQPLSLRVQATHLFMLQELAERFPGESKSGLGADLLEAAIHEAFEQLHPKDREALAEKADAAYKAFAEKAYKERGGSYEQTGKGHWAGFAWAYNSRDAKEGE